MDEAKIYLSMLCVTCIFAVLGVVYFILKFLGVIIEKEFGNCKKKLIMKYSSKEVLVET